MNPPYKLALALVIAGIAAFLAGCGRSSELEMVICQISVAPSDIHAPSRYERYSIFADLIASLTLSEISGPDIRVMTSIDFETLQSAEVFVTARCRDLGEDLSLSGDDIALQGEIRTGDASLRFEEFWDEELPILGNRINAGLHDEAREECLIRVQSDFKSLIDRTKDDHWDILQGIPSAIVRQNIQFGVPFYDYAIVNGILDGTLVAHCDHREEAFSFLARHWIERHAEELSAEGVEDIRITITTEGLELETQAQENSEATSDTED